MNRINASSIFPVGKYSYCSLSTKLAPRTVGVLRNHIEHMHTKYSSSPSSFSLSRLAHLRQTHMLVINCLAKQCVGNSSFTLRSPE